MTFLGLLTQLDSGNSDSIWMLEIDLILNNMSRVGCWMVHWKDKMFSGAVLCGLGYVWCFRGVGNLATLVEGRGGELRIVLTVFFQFKEKE